MLKYDKKYNKKYVMKLMACTIACLATTKFYRICLVFGQLIQTCSSSKFYSHSMVLKYF